MSPLTCPLRITNDIKLKRAENFFSYNLCIKGKSSYNDVSLNVFLYLKYDVQRNLVIKYLKKLGFITGESITGFYKILYKYYFIKFSIPHFHTTPTRRKLNLKNEKKKFQMKFWIKARGKKDKKLENLFEKYVNLM